MKRFTFIFLFIALYTSSIQAQDPAEAARNFLNILDAPLKAKAQFAYADDERFNWHFVPRERKGVSLHDLNKKQRDAAFYLLESSLSYQGYTKATAIINLENMLRLIEKRGTADTYRDPLNYYFTIFGTPANDSIWGWRIEGHHFSVNLTSVKGEIVSSTPNFWGSNPATVPFGTEKGKQVLKHETELGFLLVNSFSNEQLKDVMISDTALPEIITGDNRKAQIDQLQGIALNKMTPLQRKVFMQLLDTYVKNYEFGFSSKLKAKIEKAGMENLRFAWAGSLKPGIGYYYRIHGPMLIIELDNTQNNANHVHTTVRDLTNDFAEDILREHYANEHGR
ncbi:MAG TPA: DUF3500 domain-containing protein [Cyclobacteriaceae bacterium]